MVQRVDYYAVLSRAVESLERDAYAARGAIYDREHKALLKRLISSTAPCTDADIAREERAFRDAVRRIEFPDAIIQAPRTPQREPARERWPESAPPGAAKRRWWGDVGPKETRAPLGRPSVSPPEDEREPVWNDKERKSRSLVGLIIRYLVIAAILLGAGGLAYAYVAGAFHLSWLTIGLGESGPPAQRAVLHPVAQAGQTGTPSEGRAIWGTRTEPNDQSGKPDTVVTVDVDIPELHIALALSLSRETDASAGMSHLLEIRFARSQELPFGGISRLANVAMKKAETEAGESLVGTSINIAPGQFLFGLLGVPDVVRQNLQRLRTQNWLDLALVFGNGASYTLSIEKGAAGERALDEALAKWGQ